MAIKRVIVIIIIFISFVLVRTAMGQEIAGESAHLDNIIYENNQDQNANVYNYALVKTTIKNILEEKYGSPLSEEAETFTNVCQKYELNCFLLPSIAGLESTFGKNLIPETYNPFGWGGGTIYFNSWSDGIDAVGAGLRNNYINKGATTLEKIGAIYSESSTWTPRIAYFINIFETKYKENQLYLNL